MTDQVVRCRPSPKAGLDGFASHIIIVVAIYVAAAQHLAGLSFPVGDSFHSGEFLAAAISILEGTPYAGMPYTIHGIADILPAYLLDRVGVPRDFLIAYTISLYPIMDVLAVLFAVLASMRFARLFGICPLLIAPFAIYASYSLGWRDLILCLSLYMFSFIVNTSAKPTERLWVWQIMLGALTAFGLYWSFNRGVATVAGIGVPLLFLAVLRRTQIPAILSFVGFIGLFGLILPGTGLSHYFENFLKLLETSSKWQYALTSWHVHWAAIILAVNGLAFLLGLWFIFRRNPLLEQVAVLASLGILSILFTKIGLGRIDYPHMLMALWAPLLLVSLVAGATSIPTLQPGWGAIASVTLLGVLVMFVAQSIYMAAPILLTLLLTALALMSSRFKSLAVVWILSTSLTGFAFEGYRSVRALEQGKYDWLATMVKPPANPETVSDGVLWAGRKLQELNATCVFELVNAGLIHAVSGLPACSQFTYLIYAGPQHEAQLIADLRAQAPPVIVYSADHRSYYIDGITMAERYPTLNAEILSRYDEEECRFGFCIRF